MQNYCAFSYLEINAHSWFFSVTLEKRWIRFPLNQITLILNSHLPIYFLTMYMYVIMYKLLFCFISCVDLMSYLLLILFFIFNSISSLYVLDICMQVNWIKFLYVIFLEHLILLALYACNIIENSLKSF